MRDGTARPRRVTITDIAAEVGVTPATVSNAFNRPDQLSPALRQRVLAAAARMGYPGPDAAARSMRRGRLRAIGVLYTDRLSYAFADPAFVLFLHGLARAAEAAAMGMTLLPGAPRETRDPAAVGTVVVDGFVVYSMADDDPLVAAALERRLPLVVADSPRLRDVPYVGIDDEGAARAAAAHLLALGHRRFGVIAGELLLDRRSGPANATRQAAAAFGVNRARLRGYAAALEAAGVAWDRVPVEEVAAGVEDEAAAATRRLLAREPPPTALLAMSDRLARGALEGAEDAGLTVPAGLSVVGFDDDPGAERATPGLTTVRQPHVAKGRAAGDLLIARLEGQEPTSPRILPTGLVVRGTTAPP